MRFRLKQSSFRYKHGISEQRPIDAHEDRTRSDDRTCSEDRTPRGDRTRSEARTRSEDRTGREDSRPPARSRLDNRPEGLMKFDATATEENIKAIVAEHLKHAPLRRGGGGFMPS
ncbi:unnamed protein product [Merluccius merluccius]